ncbi:von Willebrand factor, type A [Acidothermus cellulolyticus 11B]|uniref:von Willebrand factor, type A n=1 Tax=Acidothermus cellulolyticus (strain ATCC 43068 / DSM 8971 / 11B) TaxID=351607 RepID=A0LW55_ACIC1|nr:VWA domain-containing protein [Acidothermus cellulolyticus]ABK53665.1 von Willebrand factor, type A [Acidothermus cellulolyticus 11B]
MSASAYRYGPFHDGPDPLAPPYDVARALDELGDDVLSGASPADALRKLLRHGAPGLRGTDDLLRQVRERRRALRESGRFGGTLEQARALLDKAIGQERAALFPDPSDDARLREAELDALPADTARAIRALADYDWRSPQARRTYEELKNLLRDEVLDTQFRGMREALRQMRDASSSATAAAVKDMLADLNDMLAADERGEHTQEKFDDFMARHGHFFPDNPRNLDELVDSLARRAAAMERMLASMSREQREELAALMAQVMADLGLAAELARLNDALRRRRPDLDWSGRTRLRGDEPLSAPDATSVLEELADLEEVAATLAQDYPGARLDDIDEEAVRRALGRSAVDDLRRLRDIERELERQGYIRREAGRLELTPKAVRRLGATALRRIFASLEGARSGGHDTPDAGTAGELTGSSRPWEFGDEQPLDVVRSLRNAIRNGRVRREPDGRPALRLAVEDFEVFETERRTAAAVCLLVDLSWSMTLRGTWGAAKATALALHSLVTTQFPQDALQIIGFSNYGRVLQPTELAGLDAEMVQGTNLQHALLIAGRFLDRHPEYEPIVMIVTDGEPTAHLLPDGDYAFDWPPSRQTITLTLAEVDKMTRRGAALNVFMLADDPGLVDFVELMAKRNGGRVFSPSKERLGSYVVSDYLRSRRGRRRAG